MTSSLTHFEIYGPEPANLAEFYRGVFDWEVEQMPGIGYWRIQTGSAETKPLHGGLTFRAIPDLNGFLLHINVASLDETVARVESLGNRTPEDRGAQDRLGHDRGRPCEKYFRHLAGRPNGLPDAGAGLK